MNTNTRRSQVAGHRQNRSNGLVVSDLIQEAQAVSHPPDLAVDPGRPGIYISTLRLPCNTIATAAQHKPPVSDHLLNTLEDPWHLIMHSL